MSSYLISSMGHFEVNSSTLVFTHLDAWRFFPPLALASRASFAAASRSGSLNAFVLGVNVRFLRFPVSSGELGGVRLPPFRFSFFFVESAYDRSSIASFIVSLSQRCRGGLSARQNFQNSKSLAPQKCVNRIM